MVEVVWLQQAQEDLKDIHDYISRDSKKYAQRQVKRILERTTILKHQSW
jgi:plasmid stabilization system protein ParE